MSKLSIIFGATTVILALFLVRSCNQADQYKADKEGLKALIASETANTKTWVDKDGLNRARINALQVSNNALNDYIGDQSKVVDGLKKDNSNLQQIINATTSSRGHVSAPLTDTAIVSIIAVNDTAIAKTFTYTDKWSKFSGTITDKIEFDYEVRDSITFFQYWKGQSFFKKGTLVMEGISHNPNTKLTGLRSINVIEPKKRRYVLGIGLQYGVGSQGLGWNFGIGLHYKVLEF
jgi:hypothetical protein